MTPAEWRSALERAGLATRGPDHKFEAQCPAHEDRNPSLSVSEGADGKVLVHCHAGCTPEEITAALQRSVGDLFPPREERPADEWTPKAEYTYTDAEGRKVFQVVRFPGKQFRQRRWTGTGWAWGMEGVERQLYRLPDVLRAKEAGRWVFLCEGEKDAEAVSRHGVCGTTMPGGVGKWSDAYTVALGGALVIVMADDDEPGRRHAAEVWRTLHGRAARSAVRLPAEGCKDIHDHLAKGLGLDKLRKLDQLVDLPANGNGHRPALTAAVFASRSSPDKSLIGPLFQRGMRTVIGAQTGEGKTSFVMQIVRALVSGEPFLDWRPRRAGRALIVDLEQGEETVKARLREAQLDTSERVDILWEPSGIALDRRPEDREMVRDVLREGGYDLVALDLLYQTHLGSGNDEQVAAGVMRIVDAWCRDFDAAFVVPMHMRKPHPDAGKNITIHDIAGVGTWLRNAEFVMGLQIMYAGASRVHFFKDRIGRGPTIRSFWWMDFERESGFTRNHREERDRIRKEMKRLAQRDEGVTRAELVAYEGSDDMLVQDVLRVAKYRHGEHYRTRKWGGDVSPDQASFDT